MSRYLAPSILTLPESHTKGALNKVAELCGYIYEKFLLSDRKLSPYMAQYTLLGSKPVAITPLPVSCEHPK